MVRFVPPETSTQTWAPADLWPARLVLPSGDTWRPVRLLVGNDTDGERVIVAAGMRDGQPTELGRWSASAATLTGDPRNRSTSWTISTADGELSVTRDPGCGCGFGRLRNAARAEFGLTP